MRDLALNWLAPIFLCFLMIFVVVLGCILIYEYYRDL